MATLGIIGLLAALVLLIVIVYRGLHIIAASLICSLLIIFTNQLPLWGTLADSYAVWMKNFVGNFLLMFFLGAVFGELMSKSGAARSIAHKVIDIFGPARAILVVVLSSAILSYGGVSVFIIIFSMYPIALFLFKEANVSKNLLPATILLGAGTFMMTSFPGTPALTNIIPTRYLGTTATAAPLIGLAASVVIFTSGYLYLRWIEKRYKAKGLNFVPGKNDVIEELTEEDKAALPSFILAIIPILAILAFIFLSKGRIDSIFAVCCALTIGIFLSMVFFWKRYDGKIMECVNVGGSGSIMAIVNTAAVVGFGGVVQAAPAFKEFVAFALGMQFDPLISASLAVNVVAGITGSSSGGLTIFMEAMAQDYLAMGIDPSVFHRICSIAAGCLDSLPHAGPNITFLTITCLTYKQAYKHMFAITCVAPILGLIVAIILAMAGIV